MKKFVVLLVMAPGRRRALLEHLHACGMEVLLADDREEAHWVLQARPLVDVVMTDETLSDGSWLKVLEDVEQDQPDAKTIVCTRTGDPSLWIDVLAHGACDLLVEPYDGKEVRRIIKVATSHTWARPQAAAS